MFFASFLICKNCYFGACFGFPFTLYLVGLGWFGTARIGICTFSLPLFTLLIFPFPFPSPPLLSFLLFTKTIISNPPLLVKKTKQKISIHLISLALSLPCRNSNNQTLRSVLVQYSTAESERKTKTKNKNKQKVSSSLSPADKHRAPPNLTRGNDIGCNTIT